MFNHIYSKKPGKHDEYFRNITLTGFIVVNIQISQTEKIIFFSQTGLQYDAMMQPKNKKKRPRLWVKENTFNKVLSYFQAFTLHVSCSQKK